MTAFADGQYRQYRFQRSGCHQNSCHGFVASLLELPVGAEIRVANQAGLLVIQSADQPRQTSGMARG